MLPSHRFRLACGATLPERHRFAPAHLELTHKKEKDQNQDDKWKRINQKRLPPAHLLRALEIYQNTFANELITELRIIRAYVRKAVESCRKPEISFSLNVTSTIRRGSA